MTTAQTIVLSVPAMTCDHCEHAIRSEVGDVVGVTAVAVDLDSKTVTVTGDSVSIAAVVAAVDAAGFDVAP
jgi:copper chaperone